MVPQPQPQPQPQMAPGQAATPTPTPVQTTQTASPQTPSLMQMDSNALRQLFMQVMNNMGPKLPPALILGALGKVMQRENMAEAAQGQMAMAQANQPTVAQQLMGTRQMAEGGVVSLSNGGDPTIEAILRKGPAARTAEENELLRSAGFQMLERKVPSDSGIARLNRWLEDALGTGKPKASLGFSSTGFPSSAPVKQDDIAKMLFAMDLAKPYQSEVPPPTPTAPTARGGSGIPAPVAPRKPTTSPLTDALADIEKQIADAIRMQGAVPPELLAERERIQRLVAEQIEARKGRSAEALREGEERLGQVMSRGIGAQDLLKMAAGIDKRKGKVAGSIAGGIAGALGEQEARREAARKEFMQVKAAERTETNLIEQMQMQELVRQNALKTGDVAAAQAATAKLAELKRVMNELRYSREQQAFKNLLDERKVAADEMSARAQMVSAQARGSGAAAPATLNPNQRAVLLEKAVDNVRQDPQTNVRLARAQQEAIKSKVPFDRQAFIDRLVQAQFEQMLAAAEGRQPAVAAPPPGRVIDFSSIK